MALSATSTTQASASPGCTEDCASAGLARPAALLVLALIAAAGFAAAGAVTSCAARRAADAESETAAATGEDDAPDAPATAAGLPHPDKPTAWHTRTLVMTVAQPAVADIHACIEHFAAVADEAGNTRDMAAAARAARTYVEQRPALAHWCFYQGIVRLDDRLAAGGPVMTTLADAFFDTMRAAWIQAQALDELTGEELYFDYLRTRYVQISADVFGRDVQVLGPPRLPGKSFPPDVKPLP